MKYLFIVSIVALTLLSCKKDPTEGDIIFKINHKVGTKDFVLDSEIYTSPTNHPYQITKLWYYVSEISFTNTDGNSQTFHSGHLIKAEDEESYFFPLENLEPGKYNKVNFQFGFKKSTNYIDYLEQTLDNQNMYWFSPLDSLAYHYMKFEGKYDSLSTGVQKQFKYHFGPTDGNDNSFNISFSIPEFEVDNSTHEIVIDMDLQEWLQNPTDYNFPDYTMVMMHQNVQEIYKANGQNVFSFNKIFKYLEE